MPISPAEFEFVRKLMMTSAAIVLDPGKEYLVETRLIPVSRRLKLSGINELIQKLQTQKDPQLLNSVVEALTTNETSFFRDVHPFEALKKVIVPEMLTKRAAEKKLSMWCGACSTGQEPYTVAIILRESFPQLANWKIEFLCTDINQTVLNQAKEGRYSQLEVNRGLPAPYLIKYFEQVQQDWVVKEDLRKIMSFRTMNLAGEWPAIPPVDIVFLRNVMIYFDVEVKKKILSRMKRVMKSDAYLFLGSAETTMNLDESYERVSIDKTICYRIGKGGGIAPASTSVPTATSIKPLAPSTTVASPSSTVPKPSSSPFTTKLSLHESVGQPSLSVK